MNFLQNFFFCEKAQKHQADNVRLSLSACWPSFCGVFHTVVSSLFPVMAFQPFEDGELVVEPVSGWSL